MTCSSLWASKLKHNPTLSRLLESECPAIDVVRKNHEHNEAAGGTREAPPHQDFPELTW
ncbi:hypothetical protein ACO0LH_20020 [Undibacterium sp. TJN19]